MKDKSTKLILSLIIIIMILGGIFIIKVINGSGNKVQNTLSSKDSNLNYSKSEIINLVKSDTNKTNYQVEYITDETKYNRKYLNKRMKVQASDSQSSTLSYIDFEKNTVTIINEENKIAIIQKISGINENYIPEDIVKIIENSNCTIEKEETISSRNAIVLNYDGNDKIGNQFLFVGNNTNNNNVDEIKYNIKMWIDKETGFLLQMIVNANNNETKTNYDLKLNTVTENDVTVPDLSQYKVTDITSKK